MTADWCLSKAVAMILIAIAARWLPPATAGHDAISDAFVRGSPPTGSLLSQPITLPPFESGVVLRGKSSVVSCK